MLIQYQISTIHTKALEQTSMPALGIPCPRKTLRNVFLWGKCEFQRLISQLLSNEFSFFFNFVPTLITENFKNCAKNFFNFYFHKPSKYFFKIFTFVNFSQNLEKMFSNFFKNSPISSRNTLKIKKKFFLQISLSKHLILFK